MFRNKTLKLIVIVAGSVAAIALLVVLGSIILVPNDVAMDVVEWVVSEEAAQAPSEPAMEPMPQADGGRTGAAAGFNVTAEKDMAVQEPTASPPAVNVNNRKIIKSAYMAIDTVEFDRTTDAIVGKAVAMGGYIESSNIQGTRLVHKTLPSRRSASFQIRIPEAQFESYMTAVGELGVVTTEQIMGQDITGQYFDTETRVRTLKTQEERLLTLLGRAEKLTDIIEIERELSRIRFEIESLTGTLKGWDHMVEFSRISIDVYEVEELQVVEPKPETWLDRIIRAFRDSVRHLASLLENIVIFLVAAIPYLIVVGLLAWGTWSIVRKKPKQKELEKQGGNDNEK